MLHIKSHFLEQAYGPFLAFPGSGRRLVDNHGFLHGIRGRMAGVQGRIGILKYHLYLPAQGLALFLPETVQLFSVINQLS